MKIILTLEEKMICHKAQFNNYEIERIGYVYFIFCKSRIIYVGATMNPILRESIQAIRLRDVHGIKNYRIDFIGPFPYWLALEIEANETARYARMNTLLNKTNIKYKRNEKFSIENFGRKTVSFVRKNGKRKEVVC